MCALHFGSFLCGVRFDAECYRLHFPGGIGRMKLSNEGSTVILNHTWVLGDVFRLGRSNSALKYNSCAANVLLGEKWEISCSDFMVILALVSIGYPIGQIGGYSTDSGKMRTLAAKMTSFAMAIQPESGDRVGIWGMLQPAIVKIEEELSKVHTSVQELMKINGATRSLGSQSRNLMYLREPRRKQGEGEASGKQKVPAFGAWKGDVLKEDREGGYELGQWGSRETKPTRRREQDSERTELDD
ncbi:uncharacterized protein EDB91DRAFT_1335337 [Suillus paluster]|uniref:uncharacterized protein n=1 Tax=Suillus paluster TaxID=48578 RepID=UPI001B869FD3|nr:uncharacterized protein EDB91DRAFT_1335337 [Suillus paluster]KAG1745440.1 hypothetical protein EDB91DRAFT_1335337 [Suillus paluster]